MERKSKMAVHDFFMVDNEIINDKNKLTEIIVSYYNDENINKYNQVKIHDDIILYINDTLKFIKSRWVSGDIKSGIDYYGYSIISGDEICKVKIIFESWRNIFKQAESEIILTGEYCWSEAEKDGEYEKTVVDKNELIASLNILINMCDRAYNDGKHILHLGI